MKSEGDRLASLCPVMWHHGQFLQPQHLQLLDKRLDALFFPYQQYVQPWLWGTARLLLSEEGLARDVVAVKEAHLLFPDGTFASIPENSHVPERSFQNAWREREKPFQVYIGIRAWRDEGNAVREGAPEGRQGRSEGRYTAPAEPAEVQDAYGDGPLAMAFRMQYRLRIFWESELGTAGDYVLLPIARLIQESLGGPRLAPDYVPPLISVSASEELLDIVRGTLHTLTERSRQLEEFKAPSSLEMKHWDVKSVLFMLALRSINRALPSLRHALAAPHIHPWYVYDIFISLLGDLSTFSDRVTAGEFSKDGATNGIPTYSHTDIYFCFKAVREQLIQLLAGLVFEPDSLVPFTPQDRFYVATLLPQHFEPGNGYWLLLYTDEDIDLGRLLMSGSLKAGELNALGIMLSNALPGIPLTPQSSPPPGVPKRPGAHYMSFDALSDQWNELPQTSRLAVYMAEPPADLRMELAVFKI